MLRDFSLLPTVFDSLTTAQKVFDMNCTSKGSLTAVGFIGFVDMTAQIYASARKSPVHDGLRLLLEKMDSTGGKKKLSTARNGMVLSQFWFPKKGKKAALAVVQKKSSKEEKQGGAGNVPVVPKLCLKNLDRRASNLLSPEVA